MKIVCCADLHFTAKIPKSRKAEYFEQALDKFNFILKETEKTESKILLVAGDFFDSPTVPYKVTKTVLELIKKYNVNMLVVSGQHDQRYHVSGLNNTPLGILKAANVLHVLKNNEVYKFKGISFVGSGWGEDPEVKADIILTHRMIVKKDPLWPGQTNYSSAYAVLRKYPWAKCVVSGDNHLPHVLRTKDNRLQINSGSMMRSTKSQLNFQPRIYIVDCSIWKVEMVKIPCLPFNDVFDMEKIVIEEMKEDSKKIAKEKIAKFIDTLPKNEYERPNFKHILNNIVEHIQPNEDVRNIINLLMERVS